MDGESIPNLQNDTIEENTTSEIETKRNESPQEMIENDEHISGNVSQLNNVEKSLSADIDLTIQSIEISRVNYEQFPERASKNEDEISNKYENADDDESDIELKNKDELINIIDDNEVNSAYSDEYFNEGKTKLEDELSLTKELINEDEQMRSNIDEERKIEESAIVLEEDNVIEGEETNREDIEINLDEDETANEEQMVLTEMNDGDNVLFVNGEEEAEINIEEGETIGKEETDRMDHQIIEDDENVVENELNEGGNEENIEESKVSDIIECEDYVIKDDEESREWINKSNQADDGSIDKVEFRENEDVEVEYQNKKVSDDIVKKNDSVSKFFTAPVQLDDGSVKNQLVTIVRSKCKKIFLGGYRHKVSGIVYHHAAVQTMPKPRPPPKVTLFSRDTQTFQLKHQKVNTDNTTSTQMTGPGLYVSNITDKLMAPKQYETADEYRERILQNIIIIQKYYRRWLAKQIVDEKRKQRDQRLDWESADKERKQREKEERIQAEYKRRMHPKTKADFDLLYSDLEKWREEQLREIANSNITEAERKARRALLLEEETDLLAAIDRHKLDRKEETKTEAVQKLLSKAAAPKTWKDAKGRKIEMNTQFTIRSRELLEIFNSLNMQYLTPDERLDVLLTLKHTVKEHDCKLTKEIVELIDREADLIMRNVKEASLVGLRKRISTLFLQYCKTPTFNPQISSLLKVPSEATVLVGDINYCKYCGRYLRSTEFSLSTKSSKLTICKSCARKDNQSRNRQDYSHYRRILKEIQMNEQQIDDGSKVAFIFKQNDVKSLIESVWDGKSVLSGSDDLDELMFLRWDHRQHWSPWNTIFLTKDEAEAHTKVTNVTDTYSDILINRIRQKHVIAKNLFGSLEKMIDDFQSKTNHVVLKV